MKDVIILNFIVDLLKDKLMNLNEQKEHLTIEKYIYTSPNDTRENEEILFDNSHISSKYIE
jgi:hypothetical protein